MEYSHSLTNNKILDLHGVYSWITFQTYISFHMFAQHNSMDLPQQQRCAAIAALPYEYLSHHHDIINTGYWSSNSTLHYPAVITNK